MPRRHERARKREQGKGGPFGPGWLSAGDKHIESKPKVGRAAALPAGAQTPRDTVPTVDVNLPLVPLLLDDAQRVWRLRDHHYADGEYPVDESGIKSAPPLPEDARRREPFAESATPDGHKLIGWAALAAIEAGQAAHGY